MKHGTKSKYKIKSEGYLLEMIQFTWQDIILLPNENKFLNLILFEFRDIFINSRKPARK